MKRIFLLLCPLLFLAVLSSCDQRKVLNLPELDELYRDISDSVPEIDSVFTEYGNSGTISITVYYGERYQNIDGKDALLIIKKVRALFMQEEFQRTLLATVCGVSRDDILSHRYGAAPVTLSINDSYRSMEAGRYKYFLEAHLTLQCQNIDLTQIQARKSIYLFFIFEQFKYFIKVHFIPYIPYISYPYSRWCNHISVLFSIGFNHRQIAVVTACET